ncbi:MAG TPA: helix-hairpin-helix domain-containing protein, partial [Candidatus Limnocylindrales bacterium]|nr:helix-hairpin-helix domain-containing protein [Candidatus Limnocylindrales bacterium]
RRARLVPAAGFALAAVLAVVAFLVAASGSSGTVEVRGASSTEASMAPPSGHPGSALLIVDVQGAVLRPGVVRLAAGARIGDAIAAAGGYGPRVATERVGEVLNLAAIVRDGDQVVVPSRDDAPSGAGGGTGTRGGGTGTRGGGTGGGSASASGGSSGPIDLNRASEAELDALPGIGPVTAGKIVAARAEQPFTSVDDLRTRKLVGAATFARIETLVTVG